MTNVWRANNAPATLTGTIVMNQPMDGIGIAADHGRVPPRGAA